jgi:hypothetical protein
MGASNHKYASNSRDASYNKTPATTKMPAETVKVSIISDMVLLHMK